MADLTKNISFQSFLLNDEDIQGNIVAGVGDGTGIIGCVVDSFDMSDQDVIQFQEKRAQRDGMDAGDVFMGTRRVRMSGSLYHVSHPLLYDQLNTMRKIMSPVLAQRVSPGDYGYLPLYFSQPTARLTDYSDGTIPLMVRAMPRAFQSMFTRMRTGGDDTDQMEIEWQGTWTCKDPGIYGSIPQDYPAIASGNASGNVTNRGTYVAPINMLIVVGSAAGSIAVTIGGSQFTITVPASTGARTIRFKGEQTVLTLEENSVENLRRDLLTFDNDTTWPLVESGDTAYSVTFTTVTPAAGSHLWFYERYA